MGEQGAQDSLNREGAAASATRPPASAFDFHSILAIADSLPVMVAYCDRDQIYRFCNKPIADWFEISRHDILGRHVNEIMGATSYALRRGHIEAALGGERQWFAASFDHPTRGMLTTQSEYIPQVAPDGAVAGVIMVVQDVTEQRAAEVALRESEARFRRIADSAPAMMWVTRADRSRDFVNDAYVEFLGSDRDAARIFDWRERIHPDDRDRIVAESIAGEASATAFELEGRYRRADGEYRWLRSVSQPRRDASGAVVGFIGVASDITVAKEAELELRRKVEERTSELQASEQRFRAIVDTVLEVIVLMAPDGTILDLNRSQSTWRADNPEEAIGKKIWDAPTLQLYPDQIEPLKAYVAEAAAGNVVRREIALVRDGRTVATLDFSLNPIFDADGQVRILVLENRDISDLKLAQEQLRQSQKMEALGQLTGGIAHDFNNLLTVVVGGLDLIARRVEDKKLLQYAQNALAAAERGARLTAQLLAFSRVQRLEVRPTLVAPLIEEMRPILRNVLGPGIAKKFDLDAQDMRIMADPTQLEVAVLNLAINARDAMPDGGTLGIASRRVRVEEDSELLPDDYIELSITDTGHGMPAEVVARAFEPFFTTKDVGKGTGLGLSMVYGMARQSGGTVRIESVPGEGTTVKLYFRRADADDDGDLPAETLSGAGAGGRKGKQRSSVLVIDDDPDVRAFIVSSLKELGHSVEEAADGPSGLAAFARKRPDVVVVDYVMPGMTGADVASRMIAEWPGQKILFVSGYSETDAIRDAAPDAALLTKPFRPDALDQAVRALIDRPA